MRVFQGPIEISGQVGNYAKAIRETEHEATAAVFEPHKFGYEYDELIYPNGFPGKWRSRIRRVRYALETIAKYDVLNYWAGHTLLGGVDLRAASSLGTPTVMTFCGSEIRPVREAAKRSEFLDPDEWPREPRDDEYLASLNETLDLAVYQYHELEPYVSRHFDTVAHVPRAVDCEKITPQQSKDDGVFRVAHAPSNRKLKGTKYLTAAVEALKNGGYDIQLLEAKGEHAEVIETLQRADVVVDQLRLGTIGVVSLEAMATETPVICYIRDDLREKYPEALPVVNGTPDNIEGVLKDLYEDPERRTDLGNRGREYVTSHHSLPKIGRRLLKVYESVL